MYVEADTLQIPQEGWKGVILDEMSIQQSIDIVRSRDNLLLVGFRDMGDETNSIKTIKEKKHQQTPSSHIFQLLYLPFLWVNKPVSVIYRVGRPITCLHVDKYPLSNKIYARICVNNIVQIDIRRFHISIPNSLRQRNKTNKIPQSPFRNLLYY